MLIQNIYFDVIIDVNSEYLKVNVYENLNNSIGVDQWWIFHLSDSLPLPLTPSDSLPLPLTPSDWTPYAFCLTTPVALKQF